jgi:CDP-paratose 2-epimerase
MKLLITGGCGFLGSNLAVHGTQIGHDVAVLDNLSRLGSSENLEWIRRQGKVLFFHCDIRNHNEVYRAIRQFKPDLVFHLAGQVAMTSSIEDPRRDFEVNALGTLNLLEAVRCLAPEATVIFSSTNKVYGDLEQYTYRETDTRYECVERPDGFDESTPLNFHSPYGCSKGCADQYVLDYARIYGLLTVVFRHSSMYGGRQYATFDQGWVAWFCMRALELKAGREHSFTISGNGKQVRDVLEVDDVVSLYFAAAEHRGLGPGEVFNIGGGIGRSLSLLELFEIIEGVDGIRMRFVKLPARQSDQKLFVADIRKAKHLLGWEPKVDPQDGVARMLTWMQEVNERGERGIGR